MTREEILNAAGKIFNSIVEETLDVTLQEYDDIMKEVLNLHSVRREEIRMYDKFDYPTPEQMEEMYQEHLEEDAKDIELELRKGRRPDDY